MACKRCAHVLRSALLPPAPLCVPQHRLVLLHQMVIFAGLMLWAFPVKEYIDQGDGRPTAIWKPLWDSINYWDIIVEFWIATRFGVRPSFLLYLSAERTG